MVGIKTSFKICLRRFLVKSRLAIWLTHYLLKIYRSLLHSESLFNREDVDLFDIKTLCAEMPYPASEMIFDNNVYGIGNVLKKYSGYKGQINAYIEHGVYFGDHYDKNQWFATKIITFSEQRKMHLSNQKVNKNAIVIGPYIYYAEELFSREFRSSQKAKLKKTLLVLPIHSTESLESKYDIQLFINKIKQIEKNYYFDTVLVCLFWKDAIKVELVNSYNQAGFKVCSAGHKWDKDFLNRLKTIISLSDITISNDVGTHIGYCLAFNKPHTILKSEIHTTPVNSIGYKTIKDEMKEERQTEVEEIRNGFIEEDGLIYDTINCHQKELINKYWGMNSIKTHDELFSILR